MFQLTFPYFRPCRSTRVRLEHGETGLISESSIEPLEMESLADVKVTDEKAPSDTIGENRVVETRPAAGEQLEKGQTVILVLSSVTCQFGVFAAEKGDVFALRRWFTITFVMGLAFVLGQANEYRHLVEEGIKLNGDGYGSMFYLTTGFHGLHVTGGLIAFIVYMIRTTMGRFTPAQATSAIVVSYYWHFVDVVWIALYLMIYWLK